MSRPLTFSFSLFFFPAVLATASSSGMYGIRLTRDSWAPLRHYTLGGMSPTETCGSTQLSAGERAHHSSPWQPQYYTMDTARSYSSYIVFAMCRTGLERMHALLCTPVWPSCVSTWVGLAFFCISLTDRWWWKANWHSEAVLISIDIKSSLPGCLACEVQNTYGLTYAGQRTSGPRP